MEKWRQRMQSYCTIYRKPRISGTCMPMPNPSPARNRDIITYIVSIAVDQNIKINMETYGRQIVRSAICRMLFSGQHGDPNHGPMIFQVCPGSLAVNEKPMRH